LGEARLAADSELAHAMLVEYSLLNEPEIPMRKPLIALATALLLVSGASQAQTLVATSNIIVRALDRSFDFTSDTTTSIRDMKLVIEARDDAASFVASQGEIRGAQLEAALAAIRTHVPEAQGASDQVLAEAILAL